MGCNCRWTEVVIGLVVVIFTLWPQGTWSKWLVVVAGALLVLHAFSCKNCGGICAPEETGKGKKKKRKR